MRKKIITMLLSAALAVSTLSGCSSSNSHSGIQSEEESIVVSTVENMSESSVSTSESVISDSERKQLSAFFDDFIDDSYKTNLYSCDILTPTDGFGGIVSIQLEADSFSTEEDCISAVTAIVIGALSSDLYASIHSFEFNMICDGQLKYIISIEDATAISSESDISDNLNILAF